MSIQIISDFSIVCFGCQVGYDLKEEIERKFDKWQEPPPVKQVKPLPAPLDGQRKKRGGRRYCLDHSQILRKKNSFVPKNGTAPVKIIFFFPKGIER